ncbi:methylmalonyl-CoA mutase subunit beta [Gracilimonas mengyeensis]|uniref:methylmalonyl-CoA mutase n=1 Tax=Gracilimonas mengyeensis TaxID=1302730 RepID=A0A521CCY2_9BACT|nr:methylmalonyl-CoA mutase subunit beta [Gracilimonas mengyeensis]SMO57235.1 methylmalonyl-CoA mutase [Gracilimonas mengyeensis]
MDFNSTLHFNEFPPISTEEWEEVIQKDLKGKNYKEVLPWKSPEGVDILPFYRREDVKNLSHQPNPVLKKGEWRILQYIETSDLKEANRLALEALENGASGLFFDQPKVASRQELEKLLDGIQLDIITLKFGPALSTPKVAEWLAEITESQNINVAELEVFYSFDPLSYSLLSGKLPAKESLSKLPGAISPAVQAVVFGNAGANIPQQLAFALAAANEYLGLNPDFARSLHFNFIAGTSYFPEIAKFRAFRLLWDRVLKEYKAEDAPVRLFAETALWNKSQTDAHNNMLRVTTEAMSAALGGCEAITVHRYDEHFAESSGFAQRIARNTQLLLQEEAYLNKVADPGSGSYYIETLTDKLAEEAWNLFQTIESKGGFYTAIKNGFIQEKIRKARDQKIDAYREKKEVMVGVNKYQPEKIVEDPASKIQPKSPPVFDEFDLIEIESIEPLNMEVELQKGDA